MSSRTNRIRSSKIQEFTDHKIMMMLRDIDNTTSPVTIQGFITITYMFWKNNRNISKCMIFPGDKTAPHYFFSRLDIILDSYLKDNIALKEIIKREFIWYAQTNVEM